LPEKGILVHSNNSGTAFKLRDKFKLLSCVIKPTMKLNYTFSFIKCFSFAFLFALILGVGNAFAQENTGVLKGRLLDQISKAPLAGANVLVKNNADSIISGAITNSDGKFELKKPNLRSFKLEFRYVGYEMKTQTFFLVSKEDLGDFFLIEDSKLLDEITISGTPLAGEMKGDTAVFNAAAFTTRSDADAEELIKKMPGVTVEGGTIRARGEEVRQVLVDGRPFFGQDPMTALRSLPAEVVDRVEFFNQQSDQSRLSGFDDGNYTNTINIVTRRDRQNGVFGRASAGYGTDDRYMTGANINMFKGTKRLSVNGLSNNINQQNFQSQDIAGAAGAAAGGGMAAAFGGGGRGGAGGGGGGFGGQQGINNINSFGLNFSDNFANKAEFQLSYFFNNNKTNLDRDLYRELILGADNRQFYEETTLNRTNNQNHRINMNLTYNISPKHTLIVRPNLSFQDNVNNRNVVGVNSLQDGQQISGTINSTRADIDGLTFSNNLTYRMGFEKRGRSLSTNIVTNVNNRDSETTLNSVQRNMMRNRFDTLNQITLADNSGFTYNANLTFTEPLGTRSGLQFTYGLSNNITDSRQEVFRIEREIGLPILDSALTNIFDNSYLTHRAGAGYRYNFDKWNINANLNYQYAVLSNERTFPTVRDTEVTFSNIIPTLNATYKFNAATNLRLNYRGNTQNPSINQLQDVVSNNNPLQLSSGNPNLDQNYSHFMTANFTKFNMEKSRTILVFAFANITTDFIGNATYIARADTLINNVIPLQRGGTYTRPENMGGSYNLRTFFTYGSYFKPLKSNLNLITSVGYNQTPGIVNGQKNFNRSTNLSQGLVLSSNISQNLDFTLSSTGTYNLVNSSLQTQNNNNFYQQISSANMFWRFKGKLFISNTAAHNYFDGLGEGFNTSFWLWNAEIGSKVFKNDRGEIKVTMFDVLGQNNSISRTVSDISIEDTRTNVLQQYYMLTFTYNLRNFAGQQSQQQRGMFPMGGGMGGRGGMGGGF
jgi:hypothetical protein